MKRVYRFLLFCFILLGSKAFSQGNSVFIPNAGQWHENALMKCDLQGGAVFMEKDGFTFSFYDPEFFHNRHEGIKDSILHFHSYKLQLENSNIDCSVELKSKEASIYNYYLGNDPNKWVSGLKGGKKLVYKNVYKDIDLNVYALKGHLKYEFIVMPGGNPEDISIKIIGAEELNLVRGDLEILTTLNRTIDQAPLVYQNSPSDIVLSSYALKDSILTYNIEGEYNLQDTLVIDPFLKFSTYSGSFANNFGYTATYDRFGFLYAGGSVFGQGYPVSMGAYDVTFNSYATKDSLFTGMNGIDSLFTIYGISDVAITKYDTTGTKIIYSTYLGGSRSELPHSLIVNDKDELYIFGTTGSFDFPVSAAGYQQVYRGGPVANYSNGIYVNYDLGTDIFVSKFNSTGTKLLGSTFFGGSDNDGLNHNLVMNYADQMRGEIILDKDENIVVATSTFSNDIPITTSALQSTIGGGQDGIVFKLSPQLDNLLWSTYFGGGSR